jgi:hypothetical protein
MQLRDNHTSTSRAGMRTTLRWLVTFVGFPIGGFIAEVVSGPVDAPLAAVVGGALTGLTVGAAQAWALRPERISPAPWIAATTLGLAVGLGIGATVVDYGTSTSDLAVQGAICGLGVGVAQAMLLRHRLGAVASLWAPALAAIWATGWIVTAGIGVDVESQYTVFGSSGAIVVTLATTILPFLLARATDRTAS